MSEKTLKSIPLIACVVAVLIALYFAVGRAPFPQAKIDSEAVVAKFTLVFFCALLIERAIEVILSIWRAEEANHRESKVQALVAALNATPAPSDAERLALSGRLETARKDLITYRAGTQRWALPIAFILGLIISATGVRMLESFYLIPPSPGATTVDLDYFRGVDIFLTAALLAGGSDPIHKILDTFRKFMEASSAKASGTKTP